MTSSSIDYRAIFRSIPGALAVLTPDGSIIDVNDGYLEVSGRPLEQLLGKGIFDVFPANPDDPADLGPAELRDSLELVAATGEPDVMQPVRYDVEDLARPGRFEERYWAVTNFPLLDHEGQPTMIIHKADEVTHIINQVRNLEAGQG
jgi:PAS domain S-box-containing protein